MSQSQCQICGRGLPVLNVAVLVMCMLHAQTCMIVHTHAHTITYQISDFGMSRGLDEDSIYYMSKGGQVPIKWTAPEASINVTNSKGFTLPPPIFPRPCCTRSTPLPVMSTATGCSCLKYGR